MIVGFALERPIERFLGKPGTIAVGLIAGGAALALADREPQERGIRRGGPLDGLWLGVAQACALFPGVSRNGATLTAARLRRFSRVDAERLSRHVALPVIGGATALKCLRLWQRGLPDGAGAVRRRGGRIVRVDAGLDAADRAGRARPPAVAVRGLPRRAREPGAESRCVTRRRGKMEDRVSDAYAAAGVDTHQADQGVAAIVGVLKTIETGRESLTVPLPGHYASVMRLPAPLAPNVGIALATDSVGSKVIVAEQTGRFDTIGIDCVAMNVNDLICVGAEPLALLDYIAVERAEPALLEAIGRGLAFGAADAGVEIPGGEVCQVPEVLRGHPSPYGFDLVGSAFGVVELDKIIDGSTVRPGDVMIGLPASGVHSNGMTLARRALLDDGQLSLDVGPPQLGGQSVADVLLEPTVIYVRGDPGADPQLRRRARPRAHHRRRPDEPAPDRVRSGLLGHRPAALAARVRADRDARRGLAAEMWEVFNMGCGFVAMVPAEQADAAVELLSGFHPGTAVIGQITRRR